MIIHYDTTSLIACDVHSRVRIASIPPGNPVARKTSSLPVGFVFPVSRPPPPHLPRMPDVCITTAAVTGDIASPRACGGASTAGRGLLRKETLLFPGLFDSQPLFLVQDGVRPLMVAPLSVDRSPIIMDDNTGGWSNQFCWLGIHAVWKNFVSFLAITPAGTSPPVHQTIGGRETEIYNEDGPAGVADGSDCWFTQLVRSTRRGSSVPLGVGAGERGDAKGSSVR